MIAARRLLFAFGKPAVANSVGGVLFHRKAVFQRTKMSIADYHTVAAYGLGPGKLTGKAGGIGYKGGGAGTGTVVPRVFAKANFAVLGACSAELTNRLVPAA